MIYSRKSVYTGKGESIENQVEMCRTYIHAHYEEVVPSDITVYEDEGFSGKSLDRPQLQQMLRDTQKQKPDCIVCYRLDRISRSVSDFAGLIEELNRRDIAFVCIKEKFDTGTPMGKAMMYIASVFAQLERETIAERVRDNMLMLAKMGRWLGGQPPTGFVSEKEEEVIIDGRAKTSCKLRVDESEMPVVRLMYQTMLSTQSVNGVGKYLAARHITSRSGKAFSLLGIKGILQNPVYCRADEASLAYFRSHNAVVCFGERDCGSGLGLLAYNKRDYTQGRAPRRSMDQWIVAVGRHKGQISGGEWVRIQGFFERKGADSKRTPASNNEYALLSGLLFCRACGSLMYAKRRSNNPQRFDYICSGKLRLGRCDCPNLNGPQIDDRVCRELMTLSIQPSQIAQRLGTLKKGLHVGRDPGEALGQKIRSCEQEMSRLLDLLAGSALDPAVIKRVNTRVSELDQEVQQMIQARDRLGAAPDLTETRALQLDALARTLTEFGALFLCATIYEKRTLVRLLIERCEWDGREFTLFRYEL